ncbi:MAG: LPXTG cell wall anchor domain-containing protein [Roseburia sp.]|nr:LPXTG cell wall anchor domain-containing protein [Roseburia sp.]
MKRFIKSLTVFALVFTMLLGSTQPILAVTTEELNNKSDTSVSVQLVNAENSTGSFTVNCAGTEDEIKVYQVATMQWNADTESFDEPQWVAAVTSWLSGSYVSLTTPALLAAQSESVQGDFFKALVDEENGIIKADGLQKWSSFAGDGEDGYIIDPSIVVEKDDNVDEKTDAYSIENVPLGIYVVVGSSGAKTYAPAVVNLIPDRDPTGKWYVDNNIEATMKAADAYMHKFINGQKTDIVTIGEEVDFTIEFPLPEYEDRGEQAIYTLTFDDVLSDAFTLDTDSVVIKYRTDAGTSWEQAAELSKDYYTALIAAPAPANNPDGYGITVWGCGYHHLKYYTDSSKTKIIEYVIYRNKYKDPETERDKYAYYYYKEGAYHVIYDSEKQYDSVDVEGLRAEYARLTGDSTGHSLVQFNADGTVNGSGGSTSPTEVQELFEGKNGYEYVASLFHNIFNITFDYNKLIENDLYNQNVDIQITYKAQVNKNIEVNSENNTNTATMKYEINAAGDKFATISDTVKAYTYGLNLVKMDGDTYQTTQATDAQRNPRFEADGITPIYEDPTYLEGAKFYVFKETDTFIGEDYKGSMPGSPDAKDLDENTKLTEYKADHTGDGQYYYYTYQATEDTTLDNGVAVTSGDTVTRVFKLVVLEDKTYGTYFNGTLTSDDEAEGVTVKGLDEGNYIVSEYLAPTGYNLLAEDMMFSIYKISDNKAEEQAGSYKLFSGNQTGDELDDDGLYTMNVLNYAGLTLPSTGGMGTMLFTMIGILLMVAAIVVIMMKNKKNMRYAAEFMAILLVVGMLFQLTPQNVYAVTEVKLNNEYGSAVTGDNKVNFTVNIKNAGDTLEVYKIAEMKYENDTYNGPSWVTGVQQKLEGSDYAAYTTPALLGEASIDDQVAFLEWLYTNKDTNNLEQNQKVPAGNITESVGGEQITVSNVDYGIYLVKAVNTISGKNYQLLTVNAIPTQEGPLGAWYIKDNISANLKFADIKVVKTINNEDGITVSMGDEVEFEIIGEVPDYPGVDTVDNEGNPAKDFSNYFFTMNDTMSDSFEFDREQGVVIEYTTDSDIETETWVELETDKYESLFALASKDTSTVGVRRCKDNIGNNDIYCIVSGPESSKYTYNFYIYSEEYGTYTWFYKLSSSSLNASISGALTDYKNTTKRTTATTLSFDNTVEWTDINNIVFDYEKLHELGAKYVRVTYNAVVTPEVVVGADDNTNTVTFHYQKDLSGAGGSSSDTAYAWTYGLNIVKKDGDDTSTYLANAKFKLYKEAHIYVPSDANADKTEATYANYEFLMNVDETTDVPTGIISAEQNAVAETLDTLAELNSVINGDYYYRYVAYEADKCGVETCAMKDAAHSHVLVYKFIGVNGDATSEIVSVANASGVTVKGLAPASYVLIETSAPTGYNKLQEALRFEIQELTVDQASALGHHTEDGKVSLKGFASDETYEKTQIESDTSLKYAQVGEGDKAVYYKVYEDGIYPIEVENFKGLTLPSTGGMGTLFFTLIGLFVMTAALVVIIAKRNGQKYIEY